MIFRIKMKVIKPIYIAYTPTQTGFIDLNMLITRETPRIMRQMDIQLYIGRGLFLLLCFINLVSFVLKDNRMNLIYAICFLIIAILYSRFNLWVYKKNIQQKYKRIEKQNNIDTKLIIENGESRLSDEKGTYSMKVKDFLKIIEVSKYFFIQLHTEVFLFIPKDQLDDVSEIRTELQNNTSEYAIPYITKLDWSNNIYSKKSIIPKV